MKVSLALSCSKPSKKSLANPTPFAKFCKDHFDQHLPDSIKRELGDGKHLFGTSLQYLARQMAADFSNMMTKQLWPVTIYWVRKELVEMEPLLRALPVISLSSATRLVMKWMFAYALGERVVFFSSSPCGNDARLVRSLYDAKKVRRSQRRSKKTREIRRMQKSQTRKNKP